MTTIICILFILTILILILPAAGAFLSGTSLEVFTTFPPLTEPAAHPSFSWILFLLYLLFSLAVLSLIILAALNGRECSDKSCLRPQKPIPWWGLAALGLLFLFWVASWTRLSWFEPLQRHTFLPLWLCYIFTVNGFSQSRCGFSLLLARPLVFLCLFPLSAAFWWVFEYLNQFVDNWFYLGVDYGPLAYSLHASLSFSTVLPAVYSTRLLLFHSPFMQKRFCGLPPLRPCLPRHPARLVLPASCLGLLGVGLWPEEMFFLLWLAPLGILVSLKQMAGLPTLFSDMAEGDWRPAISAALAALVCGFFWEMWNDHSQAKWIYSIPYVHRYTLFEMPILGYMGYLPFGMLCIELVELVFGRNPHTGAASNRR
ncbi:MAG TPA: hypothetical protein VJ969_10410 [Desulfopila sp.]|nr:hypothetical protein [Desulfopila sp.]